MSPRITIDPVTRIEGHLRVDLELDGASIRDAWASGQMWRGIEVILKGRDPRDAWLFTQRICGVCTTVHAITSVRSVENALGLQIPPNAQYIRNVMMTAHALHDHIVHFYHLSALDWVDLPAALQADPAAASRLGEDLSSWPMNSRHEMEAVQERVRTFVDSGQLGIFGHGYWGHPAMQLPPEVNLLAVAHYLQALDYQRKANQVVALLGGKTPHVQNLAVGGVTNPINLDNTSALNIEKLQHMQDLLTDVAAFVQQAYFVDACAIAALYPDWWHYGAGVTNYLCTPDLPVDAAASAFDLPGGVIVGGDLKAVRPIRQFADPYFQDGVAESTAHSWYEGDAVQHPWKEDTVPHHGDFDAAGKYSWVKAPRFQGRPMQVGPLAELLVGYATGHDRYTRWTDRALSTVSKVAGKPMTVTDLHSTVGRHLARAVRAAVLSELALKHFELLKENIGRGDVAVYVPPTFPAGEIRGFGVHEAPRGMLSHWIVIRDGAIANYQAVVPSTWNASPRDAHGERGPYEAALRGNPIATPEQPLEALRTIHSFDPCIACAVHVLNPRGAELASVSTA
jgi:hydrogenase large subunit